MIRKLIAAATIGAACLGLTVTGASTAAAQASIQRAQPTVEHNTTLQVSAAKKVACEYYYFVNGNGVRIRKTPGGTVLGYAWYGERITPGAVSGAWWHVTFYQRQSGLRSGWIHGSFINQTTCTS